MFKGSMVAIITPMKQDGSIDKNAFKHLIAWHIAAKTAAIIVAGTTGESATLNKDEHFDLIETAVREAKGRVPIIAGTGTNATESAIVLTQQAKRAGADACLIVTPYYNKPTQKGLIAHYQAIADTTDLPIILYNVPGRTGCDLLPETIAELASIKNIIAIKEATGKIERTKAILQHCGPRFLIYSGDDVTALSLMRSGAQGVISVTANVAPEKMVALCDAALDKRYEEAEKINQELMLLHQHLFLEPNPIPTKWALTMMNKIQPGIRLPLLPLDKQYHDAVKQALQQAGVTLP